MELETLKQQMYFTVSNKSVIEMRLIDVPKYLQKALFWNVQDPWVRTLYEHDFSISLDDNALRVSRANKEVNFYNEEEECVFKLYVKNEYYHYLLEYGNGIYREFTWNENDTWEVKEKLLSDTI